MEPIEFNEVFKRRTKKLAISVMRFYAGLSKKDETRIIGKQLIRSATSVAANFRTTCLARSIRERYSKFCIVVEEADETLFWIELLEECHLGINVPKNIKEEAFEILKVMASCKKGIKAKL